METWRRNLYITMAMVFVAQASFTLITPFLPYVLKSMEVQENLGVWSGMAYSAAFLTSALMAPIWGSVADKYGKRLQILRSGVGIALTYFFYPAAKTPMQFVLMRGLTGFLSGFLPAATSLVATNTPEDKLGYALGLFQATSAAGTISGPLIGGIMVDLLGIPVTFRTASVLLLVFTVIPFLLIKEDVVRSDKRISVLGDIRTSLANRSLMIVFLCLFLVQAGIQVTQPTLVLYIDMLSEGRDSTLVSGIVYSIAGLGTVLGASYAAKKGNLANGADKRGSMRSTINGSGCEDKRQTNLFLLGILGSATFSALQGLWVHIVPLAAFRLVFGAFNGILTVAGNVLVATAVTKEFRGRAFGVMSGVLPLGSVTGPILGGMVGDTIGLGSTFYASSLVFLLAAGAMAGYQRKSRQAADLPTSSSAG